MPKRIVRLRPTAADVAPSAAGAQLTGRFAAIRSELKVPEGFPAQVSAEATRVAGAPLESVDRDETAVPFLTIDPPGSMDLDQALHISRSGDGYRVRYAITYLPRFVAPGGAVDAEARKRGQTVYCPDERAPLHPKALSEGVASLLPGAERTAYVWDLTLAADGSTTATDLYRARVMSTDRMDYAEVQRAVDDGTADERLMLLQEVGERRIALEAQRGGASLPMPEQEVTEGPAGDFHLRFRPPVPCEEWNAQISLMTGMAAADLMLRAGVGILRTMPPAAPAAVERFRRHARALGVEWPGGVAYGAFLRSLDRTNPKHLALIHAATSLFRGAGYTPFDGTAPAATEHAAVAAPYAHVTAPLRRLVDRFGLAVCAAVVGGSEVPAWAREALPTLPAIMATSDHTASRVERECTDTVEAAVLVDHLGEAFAGVLVERDERGAIVQLVDPAVVARAQGPGELGADVTATLTKADVATSTVEFQLSSVVG